MQDELETHTRIQGGLLGDALSSLFAVLATSMPNTTFSQNNGVISLTRCASRQAGLCAAGWLIFMGVFAKVSGFFTSIPDCVLGGMTTFLFASVTISGIRIMCSTPGGIGRRERCEIHLGEEAVVLIRGSTCARRNRATD
jgi:xanthine/uracil permease